MNYVIAPHEKLYFTNNVFMRVTISWSASCINWLAHETKNVVLRTKKAECIYFQIVFLSKAKSRKSKSIHK